MTSAAGRATISYIVRCALPAGRSIVKRDQRNIPYTFTGRLGVAPEWENGACGTDCQELVSACVLAHVNTTGKHIQLWLDSDSPAIGWGAAPTSRIRKARSSETSSRAPPRPTSATARTSIRARSQAGWAWVKGHPSPTPSATARTARTAARPRTIRTPTTATRLAPASTMSSPCGATSIPTSTTRSARAEPRQMPGRDGRSGRRRRPPQQYDYYGGSNQKWRIRQVVAGPVHVHERQQRQVPRHLGRLDRQRRRVGSVAGNGGATSSGHSRRRATGTTSSARRRSPSSSIEVPNGTAANGAFIQQWPWNGAPWQQWSIVPAN